MCRMHCVAGVVVTLLAIAVSHPANAGVTSGLNLYWDDCSPASGGAGVTDRSFDCAANSGQNVIVGSFSAPYDLPQFVGVQATIDLVTTGVPLPAWWNMQIGGCRAGSCTMSLDFTSGLSACHDVWAGDALGAMSYDYPPLTYGSLNAARIRLVAAVEFARPVLADGTEHYAFKLTIDDAKTVGAGACAGCASKGCIVFTSMLLAQTTGYGDYLLTTPISNTWITWQGLGADCQLVPVRNRTWGSLKSLYRP